MEGPLSGSQSVCVGNKQIDVVEYFVSSFFAILFIDYIVYRYCFCLQIDHDVTSNYGNWLYSAGIGNDPREDRKFNMIKQGLDYDPNVSRSTCHGKSPF